MTPEQLCAVAPALGLLRASAWAAWIAAACERFDINTSRRQAAFLAQAAHESAGFTRLQENLAYKTEARLLQVFGRRFVNAGREPRDFLDNAEALANFVYAGRLGNGNEATGDGWRFRGRGLFQLTGRKNYRMAGDAIGWPYDETPDLLLDPMHAALTAAWFWKVNGCNERADEIDFIGVTQRINGPALAGLEDRRRYWMAAREALGDIA